VGHPVAVGRRRAVASGAFHVVLLAGGSGTRFWPLSRRSRPKPFLALAGTTSLLRQAWDRARKLAPRSRIWIVTPKPLASLVRRELPGLAERNLILEPSPRDTGPAVALASVAVHRRDPSAMVAVLPTDHVIGNDRAFVRAVTRAARTADAGTLVCLGVTPRRPETGYGYLRVAGRGRRSGALRVEQFIEKPDSAKARRFVAAGRYLWNSGIFVFKAADFLDVLDRVAPALRAAGDAGADGRVAAWRRAPVVSVDRAVLEKAPKVAVVPLSASWEDVGSWDAAARLATNARARRVVLLDSPGSVVFGGGRTVAVLGVPGVVLVATPDAILVVSRASAERVRDVVAELRRRGSGEAL